MQRHVLFSALIILIFVGALCADVFPLHRDVPTKLEGGVNITTEDFDAKIYENYTSHYYVMRIPTRKLTTTFGRLQTQILFGSMQISDLSLYPITNERNYSVIDRRTVIVRQGNKSTNNITGAITRWTEFTTGNATNQLDTPAKRNYIIEVQTPTWQTGRWGGTGALSFDPNITACGELSTAGTTYTMNQSITAGSQNCIEFGTQNITLDCQGYSIRGNGVFGYIGILTNRTNSTIKNCNVSNFGSAGIVFNGLRSFVNNSNITESTLGNGIIVSGADGSTLSFLNLTGDGAYNLQTDGTNINFTNITIRAHNQYTPIVASGTGQWFRNITILNSSFGIYFQGAYDSGVHTCYQEVGSYGFSLFDSHNINITNCRTNVSTAYSSAYPSEAGWWGAYYSQSYPTTWINITSHSERVGFLLGEFALDTTIINSTIITSGEQAINLGADGSAYIYGSTLISKNQTYHNMGTETGKVENSKIVAQNGQVALLTGTIQNTFINNTFEGNGTVVLDLEEYAVGNTFINNTFKSRNATLIEAHSSTYNNLFYWNNFTNTSGLYVNDSAGNYWNTTIAGSGEGNIWANIFDGSVSFTGTNLSDYGGGLYIGLSAYTLASSAGKFNCVSGCSDAAPLTPYLFVPAPPSGGGGGEPIGGGWIVQETDTSGKLNEMADKGMLFSLFANLGLFQLFAYVNTFIELVLALMGDFLFGSIIGIPNFAWVVLFALIVLVDW